MRTTIELPDDLLKRAKSEAALSGVSLKEFFISAVEAKLQPVQKKGRLQFPLIPGTGEVLPLATREEIEEAIFGPLPDGSFPK